MGIDRRLVSWLPAAALVSFALTAGAALEAQGPPGAGGFVQFRGASFPVQESDGEVIVVVRRHGSTAGEVGVSYETVDGSALAGEDYTATAGTLIWPDGDGEDKTIVIEILVDEVDEPLETFGVVLSEPTGEVTLGAVASTVVRILPHGFDAGDPEPDENRIQLRSAVFPAFESAGAATFVVVRKGDGAGAASVDYLTLDGSATAGEDYEASAGTLAWGDGETGELAVTVPLVDDAIAEGNETISVVLTNAVGAALGRRDTASILVIDNDRGSPGGECVADEETLCLGGNRFALSGSWTDFQGGQGTFRAVPSTDETGMFWFFDAANLEVLVKILRGCGVNGHHWVFFSATTNVAYELEVVDLATGATRTYTNPLGTRAAATTDVDAFACVP